MEKRRSERISDTLDAEIMANNTKYPGIIMNFSEDGLYMVTATTNTVVSIAPHTLIEIDCKLPSGTSMKLSCEVIWFQTKTSPHGTTFSMGMQIKDPTEEYKAFLKQLR
jgi:hypothetical protein